MICERNIGGRKMKFRFTRRWYGKTVYTWADVLLEDGYWYYLGDPWPAAYYPTYALVEAIGWLLDMPDKTVRRKSA